MQPVAICTCAIYFNSNHVIKLKYFRPKQAVEDSQGGWMGYFSKAVSASANYLPTQVTDVFNQGRAFASVRLPFQNRRNVCAITMYVVLFLCVLCIFLKFM